MKEEKIDWQKERELLVKELKQALSKRFQEIISSYDNVKIPKWLKVIKALSLLRGEYKIDQGILEVFDLLNIKDAEF